MLDRVARGRLRTLSKNNADLVARHLVMAGRLIDTDAEAAYEHAQAAVRRAGRVDVVREALAVTAYATGRYAEALRELRTVRRLSGVDAHRPMEADCERGLHRPERALAIVAESDLSKLSEHDRVELAIVASGARADLGETEAGLLVLESASLDNVTEPELRRRLDLVRAERLEELGRTEEAAALRDAAGPEPEPEEEIVVHDLQGEIIEADGDGTAASPEKSGAEAAATRPDQAAEGSDEQGPPGRAEEGAPSPEDAGAAVSDPEVEGDTAETVADLDDVDDTADLDDVDDTADSDDVDDTADSDDVNDVAQSKDEDGETPSVDGGALPDSEHGGSVSDSDDGADESDPDDADAESDQFEQAELDLDVSEKE